MQHVPDLQVLLRNIHKTSAFLCWLRQDGGSLVSSAALLGGHKWAKRAQAIVDAARAGHDMAARRGELHALYRLLNLERVNNIESEEAQRFASIHPDDPRADAARHCAEAMARGVRALESLRLAGLTNLREAA